MDSSESPNYDGEEGAISRSGLSKMGIAAIIILVVLSSGLSVVWFSIPDDGVLGKGQSDLDISSTTDRPFKAEDGCMMGTTSCALKEAESSSKGIMIAIIVSILMVILVLISFVSMCVDGHASVPETPLFEPNQKNRSIEPSAQVSDDQDAKESSKFPVVVGVGLAIAIAVTVLVFSIGQCYLRNKTTATLAKREKEHDDVTDDKPSSIRRISALYDRITRVLGKQPQFDWNELNQIQDSYIRYKDNDSWLPVEIVDGYTLVVYFFRFLLCFESISKEKNISWPLILIARRDDCFVHFGDVVQSTHQLEAISLKPKLLSKRTLPELKEIEQLLRHMLIALNTNSALIMDAILAPKALSERVLNYWGSMNKKKVVSKVDNSLSPS